MRVRHHLHLSPTLLAFAALLAAAAFAPPGAVAQGDLTTASQKTVVACIEGMQGPSTRQGFEGCFEPASLQMRSSRSESAVAMSVGVNQIERFRRRMNTGNSAEVKICVINGANICFEESYEIVWVCITTGLLAGETCPEVPSEDAPTAVVGLASVRP